MTKARENSDYTGLAADIAAGDTAARAGRKNLIINGAMNVAQRGTSQTAGGYGSLDRWRLALSGASATLSQETFTVGQTDVPNEPENYMKLNVTTGNNNCGFEYRVENVRSVVGVHTLSFWAKGVNPAGGEVIVKGEQRFDNSTNEVQITGDEITLTTSWQKFTISMTPTSLTGTGTPGASSYVRLQFLQPTGDTGTAAWNINIAQVQLELGSVATDFEHRSYGEILADCQRYYEIIKAASAWSWTSSTGARIYGQFRTEKRASPSVSGSPIIIGNGNSAYTQSSFAGPSTTAYGFDGYCYNFTSVTTARPYTVLSTMNFDAEL